MKYGTNYLIINLNINEGTYYRWNEIMTKYLFYINKVHINHLQDAITN